MLLVLSTSRSQETPPTGFEQREEPGFRIYFRPEDRGPAERLARYAARSRPRIARELGVAATNPIRVYLAASEEDYQALQPAQRLRERWSVGVAYPRQGVIVLYAPRGRPGTAGRYDFLQVFTHELVHILLHEALGDVEIPAWLHEGYAKYRAHERELLLPARLTWAWLLGRMIPLEELIHRFPREEGPARLAYDESVSFVAYLIDRRGPEGFQTFLAWLAAGKDVDEALRRTTGKDLAALEAEWLSFLALRYTVLGLFLDTDTLWAVAALLILLGWWRVRARKKRRLAQMEAEEAALYGPRRPAG